MITGIHHISMKYSNDEELAAVRSFYLDVLGFKLARKWENGMMIDTGSGLLEITAGNGIRNLGAMRHVAFGTDDVDGIIASVKAAGYEVFIEPKDIVLGSEPGLPARIAFCFGPLGEQIEFFQER